MELSFWSHIACQCASSVVFNSEFELPTTYQGSWTDKTSALENRACTMIKIMPTIKMQSCPSPAPCLFVYCVDKQNLNCILIHHWCQDRQTISKQLLAVYSRLPSRVFSPLITWQNVLLLLLYLISVNLYHCII